MKLKSFAQLVLKTIGITAIIIVLLNLLSAVFSVIQLGEKISALHYQYGLFEVNGKPVGMNFVDLKYWFFYITLFIVCFAVFYRKSNKNLKAKIN